MTLSKNPWYCADIIRAAKPDFTPRVAFILGSGLGALADQIDDAVSLSYEKLPGFPVSTVHGHAGELVLGHLAGVPVACMKGRGHFYEGRGMTIMTDAIRTFKLLGCELLFSTNAAGSLRPEVLPGSLVALSDHINTMPGTPMVGLNDERFGDRFFSWPMLTTRITVRCCKPWRRKRVSRCMKGYLSLIRARTSRRRQRSA